MKIFKIDYKMNKTDLCEIGKKYDTDKSSQRDNVTDYRHCHPYTLFYEGLFSSNKGDIMNIAEIGILFGSSLLMWKEYFINSNIYGFEYDNNLINNFRQNCDNTKIILDYINVTDRNSIKTAFNASNCLFDIIIEDTTHLFEDQINVIENIYQYLKPGGILIIEDIFKSYKEIDYINRLQHILSQFQDYYFIELDHVNRVSTGWDNDKLFVLIKCGADPIFKYNNKFDFMLPVI